MLAQAIQPAWALAAAALSAAGALALFESWRRRSTRHRRLMAAGWLAVALSVPLWIAAGGPDRGAALAGLSAMAAVSILLAIQYGRQDGKPRRAPSRTAGDISVPVSPGRIGRTVYVALLAVVPALASAVFLAGLVYAAILAAGLAQPDALFWSVLVLPTAWGALMIIPALDLSLRTRSLVMGGVTILSGAAFAAASLV
ncbi:hypothetical protein AY599_06945 [Leptolyngbya valderiana BDU 20041]|nr:hypothetical protein AY599_06945 [Leptolyngbya valderiana BDU 20041]